MFHYPLSMVVIFMTPNMSKKMNYEKIRKIVTNAKSFDFYRLLLHTKKNNWLKPTKLVSCIKGVLSAVKQWKK